MPQLLIRIEDTAKKLAEGVWLVKN